MSKFVIRRILVLASVAGCLACLGKPPSQAVDTTSSDLEVPVQIMIAKDMKKQVAHWTIEGSMGIIVAKKDQHLIDDNAMEKLSEVFNQIFEDYHLMSANLCKNEKPSDEWSDEEWTKFKGEPIDRLNAAIGSPVVAGIFCEGMVSTEYEPVFKEQP